MTTSRASAASARGSRRWHLPPPLMHGAEPLEGGMVLGEIPGPLGLVLWQALRDVLLWADTPPGEREGLFATEAAAGRVRAVALAAPEAPLMAPLAVLTRLLEEPEGTQACEVASACSTIADWAEGRGMLATALAFAQDAALADVAAPAAALAVARLATRRGDHARAELWYRRAVGIARRVQDWRLYTRSFSGLGMLYQDRGNLPAARRFHLRALRGARRGGLSGERAEALHDLFAVAVEAGRPRDAERYAREAFLAYAPRSPRLPILAHDVAYFWMEQGHFARALAVFRAVAPRVERPAERLWVEADLMRAAAGAGETALARQMARRVREGCERTEVAAAAARAQLEIARGELQLGDWDAAEAAASASLRLATEQHEGRTILMAEALLDAIRSARAVGVALPREAPIAAVGSAEETLAEDLIRTLHGLPAGGAGNRDISMDPTEKNVDPEPRPEARAH